MAKKEAEVSAERRQLGALRLPDEALELCRAVQSVLRLSAAQINAELERSLLSPENVAAALSDVVDATARAAYGELGRVSPAWQQTAIGVAPVANGGVAQEPELGTDHGEEP